MHTINQILELNLEAHSDQRVQIKIFNIVGEVKMSTWKELTEGKNCLKLDVSGLLKGTYRLTISYLNEKLKEERFTLY
ncbi:MAG: T9SS type A sorting domain-containing protein [Cytophagaceae bacterium]|jgi:hypothetical protein|nr:T9SS type A sorting domain-containing protein [Cytophagaceae bacterium]